MLQIPKKISNATQCAAIAAVLSLVSSYAVVAMGATLLVACASQPTVHSAKLNGAAVGNVPAQPYQSVSVMVSAPPSYEWMSKPFFKGLKDELAVEGKTVPAFSTNDLMAIAQGSHWYRAKAPSAQAMLICQITIPRAAATDSSNAARLFCDLYDNGTSSAVWKGELSIASKAPSADTESEATGRDVVQQIKLLHFF